MKWQAELSLAELAAKSCGEILRQAGKGTVLSSEAKDLKNQSDLDSEKKAIEILKERSSYKIICEETGGDGALDDLEPIWIIDPLDGTLNYTRGLDLCCVSIALWQNMKPILGVIYNFNTSELYSGIVGEGAQLNGQPMLVSSTTSKSSAILTTGFPVNRDFGSDSLNNFLLSVQEYKKVRLFGSAALSLAFTASGKVDVYSEEDIMIWDVAAGLALVEAAGGKSSYIKSTRINNALSVTAGTPALISS